MTYQNDSHEWTDFLQAEAASLIPKIRQLLHEEGAHPLAAIITMVSGAIAIAVENDLSRGLLEGAWARCMCDFAAMQKRYHDCERETHNAD